MIPSGVTPNLQYRWNSLKQTHIFFYFSLSEEATVVSPPRVKGVRSGHLVQPALCPTVVWGTMGQTGATKLCWNSSGPPQTSLLQRTKPNNLLHRGEGWGEVQAAGCSATAVPVHVKGCQHAPIISTRSTAGRGPTHGEGGYWKLVDHKMSADTL